MFNTAIPHLPVKFNSPEFVRHRYVHYQWMHREALVCRGQFTIFKPVFVASYAQCRQLLQDPRLVRNRRSMKGRSFHIPLLRNLEIMMKGLVNQDDPIHKRQRLLVAKVFTPRALEKIENRVFQVVEELLDDFEGQSHIDLVQRYSLQVPTTVIREMLGIEEKDITQFQALMSTIMQVSSSWDILKIVLFDLSKAVQFIEYLLDKKRHQPADDILTALIQAEEKGEKLSHDELIAMTFTLIVAGYETTIHLISNAVVALLAHPEQLARLKENPELIDTAIEEVLRFYSPFQFTELSYAAEDLEVLGMQIPRKTIVLPLLGAANRDPTVFESPDTFDITRAPNKHLAFGHGIHHCLGAALARMEGKVAVSRLVQRFPDLQLSVPQDLEMSILPSMHSYQSVPIRLK